MTRIHTFGVAVGLAVTLSVVSEFAPTWAQGPGKDEGAPGRTENSTSLARTVGNGPQTPITVLMSPAVQKELKLTEGQKNKVFNVAVASTQKQRDQVQSLIIGGEGGMNPQGMLAARDAMRQENEQAVAQILDDKQKERFNQIVLRAEGPLAVARPEVAAKLRLNDTQRGYVQSIMTQMQQTQFMMVARMRQGAAMGQGQVGPSQIAQMHQMMDKVREGAVQQLSKVIDAKQKAAFNKMLGEPFDLAKLDAQASPEAEPGAAAAAKPGQEDPALRTPTPTPDASAKEDPTPEKAAKSSGRSARKKARPRTKSES